MIDSFSKQQTNNKGVAATPNEKGFARIQMLLEATGGLSLSQVCAVTGLEGSTIQNWVKRGWVEHPVGKKYEEVHIARILIINALKECIKLENIAKLMEYINGRSFDKNTAVIKESTLYSYLCEALVQSGQSEDNSRSGIEAVIDNVIKDYSNPDPDARGRIRKALILMMFACVCTDVKRRTEAMMGQILKELGNTTVGAMQSQQPVAPVRAPPPAPAPPPMPKPITLKDLEAELESAIDISSETAPLEAIGDVIETRKTVSQALREWDTSSVEKIIIDYNEEVKNNEVKEEEVKEKPGREPWYTTRKK